MDLKIALLFAFLAVASATVHFSDRFEDESWEKRWVYSTDKGNQAGKFKLSSGKFYGDKDKDLGIQTAEDAKFYQMSSKIETPFSSQGKTLVLQFTVKHEQSIDCGGGYIKLYPASMVPEKMSGDSEYFVMFGPDICGPGTKRVHVIFNHKGNNLLTKKDIKCKDDEFTHLYTLIVNPDSTYEVRIDNEKVESGELEADWDFLAPKKIKDPEAKKPEDWDDRPKINDPDDTKPEGYDKPELIADPEAKKPSDWDDEEDGEWEPPMISNPEYKGEWKAAQIDNPAYKGEWVHPEIDNPDYKPDTELAQFDGIGHVGFELWQVKSGTIFDNILVTDTVAEAEKEAKELFDVTREAEKKMKEKQDEEERKKTEEEEKKRKEEEDKKKPEEKKEEETEEEDEADEADEADDKTAKPEETKEEAVKEEAVEEEKPVEDSKTTEEDKTEDEQKENHDEL